MTAGPSRPRPAVGVDGYPRGWVAAVLADDRITWSTSPVTGIADLLSSGAVIGIDMPIGLSDSGLRACDDLARRALPGAGSRVFTTPPRAVLEAGLAVPNDDVQALSRALTGQGVSRQSLGLATRILALDAALDTALTDAPDRARDVVEVHPELSFAALAGRVLAPKKSAAGVGQRIHALLGWRSDIASALGEAPPDVPVDDALDALAALWSAVRWRDGVARTLPDGATARPFIAT